MRSQEFTGKTTQEAIDAGLAALGVTIADVHVDVLQEGAKGLFGLFGSKPARVRLTVMEDEREDDHGLSDLLGSFSLGDAQPRKKPQQRPAPKAETKPAPKAEAKPAPKADAQPAEPAAQAAPKPRNPRPPCPPKPRAPRQEAQPKETAGTLEQAIEERENAPMIPAQPFEPTEPPVMHDESTPAGRAQRFLIDVTARMGVKVDVYVDASKEDSLYIHMIGDTLGILIGRRGETLDALQYLTSLQVNKGREGYIRVTLDTENYRAKREDSLRRLAQRMANRAQKTGRSVVLEPMNPYERRVLHTALQNHPAVTTHSEGEEPNRRVVIMLRSQPERAAQGGKPVADGKGDKPAGARKSRSRRRGRKRGPAAAAAQEALTAPQETAPQETAPQETAPQQAAPQPAGEEA